MTNDDNVMTMTVALILAIVLLTVWYDRIINDIGQWPYSILCRNINQLYYDSDNDN